MAECAISGMLVDITSFIQSPENRIHNHSGKIIRFNKQNYTNVINKKTIRKHYTKSKWLWPWQRYKALYKLIPLQILYIKTLIQAISKYKFPTNSQITVLVFIKITLRLSLSINTFQFVLANQLWFSYRHLRQGLYLACKKNKNLMSVVTNIQKGTWTALTVIL